MSHIINMLMKAYEKNTLKNNEEIIVRTSNLEDHNHMISYTYTIS